jgi:hypothetical protein
MAKTVAETLVSIDIVVLNRLRALKVRFAVSILGLSVQRWRITCGRLWPVQRACCCIVMVPNRRDFPSSGRQRGSQCVPGLFVDAAGRRADCTFNTTGGPAGVVTG